jgi:hypothetical protein
MDSWWTQHYVHVAFAVNVE